MFILLINPDSEEEWAEGLFPSEAEAREYATDYYQSGCEEYRIVRIEASVDERYLL